MDTSSLWSSFAPILAISTGIWGSVAALGDFLEFKDKNLKEWRSLEWFRNKSFAEQNRLAKLRVGQWIQIASKFLAGAYALWIAYFVFNESHQDFIPQSILAFLLLAVVFTPTTALLAKRQRRLDIAKLDRLAMAHLSPTEKDGHPRAGYDPDIQLPVR